MNWRPVVGSYKVTGVVTPFTVCVNPEKSPVRCAGVGTVPYRFEGVVFRCPVTFKKMNCFVLAFTSPGIDGDPVKLNPNRFVL